MRTSLEEERRALLEQIEASRAVYRRMLTGEPETLPPRVTPEATHSSDQPVHWLARSRQWAVDHPLLVASAAALIVLAVPQLLAWRRAAARPAHRSAAHPADRQTEQRLSAGAIARPLLSTALLLLRDPRRLQALARAGATLWAWAGRRRQQHSTRPRVPPH